MAISTNIIKFFNLIKELNECVAKEKKELDRVFLIIKSFQHLSKQGIKEQLNKIKLSSSIVCNFEDVIFTHIANLLKIHEDERDISKSTIFRDRIIKYYMDPNNQNDIHMYILCKSLTAGYISKNIKHFVKITEQHIDDNIVSFFDGKSVTTPKCTTVSGDKIELFYGNVGSQFCSNVANCDSYNKYIDLLIEINYGYYYNKFQNIFDYCLDRAKLFETDSFFSIFKDYFNIPDSQTELSFDVLNGVFCNETDKEKEVEISTQFQLIDIDDTDASEDFKEECTEDEEKDECYYCDINNDNMPISIKLISNDEKVLLKDILHFALLFDDVCQEYITQMNKIQYVLSRINTGFLIDGCYGQFESHDFKLIKNSIKLMTTTIMENKMIKCVKHITRMINKEYTGSKKFMSIYFDICNIRGKEIINPIKDSRFKSPFNKSVSPLHAIIFSLLRFIIVLENCKNNKDIKFKWDDTNVYGSEFCCIIEKNKYILADNFDDEQKFFDYGGNRMKPLDYIRLIKEYIYQQIAEYNEYNPRQFRDVMLHQTIFDKICDIIEIPHIFVFTATHIVVTDREKINQLLGHL